MSCAPGPDPSGLHPRVLRISDDPLVLVQPTHEMRRWADRLRGLLRVNVVGSALVTPIAHVANGSLGFQTYLYDIFHRTWPAKLGHALLMPTIVVATLATAALVHPIVGAVAGALLVAWYMALGLTNRVAGLALVCGLAGVLFTALAISWAESWRLYGVWAHPLVAWGLLGGAQALSHLTEPDVPPRASGCDDWVPLADYFRRAPVRHGVRAAGMLVAGAMNEMWAGWRLFPIVVLDLLWSAGYQPEVRASHRALVARAMEGGNPAVDYIGRGGGRPIAYERPLGAEVL